MFDINFTYLINLILPPNLRKPKQIAWLSVLLSYLKKIYENFVLFRIDKLYDINFTGQIMYLEKKLQDTFNIPDLFISDGYIVDNVYLHNLSENALPIFFYNESEEEAEIYLYNSSEHISSQSFIINIPEDDYNNLTSDDLSKLNKIVNYYKLVDKQYTINIIPNE